MKQILSFIWELFKIVIIALLIVIPIREYVFQPFFVRGESMEPNFHNYDYLIVDELSYHFRPPKRGEVIVFRNPYNPSQRFIKRVVGLPGEKIEIQNGKIKIEKNGKSFYLEEPYLPKNFQTSGQISVQIKQNQFFVLGDNRSASYDSRYFGPIERREIIGRVVLRLWPSSAFAHLIPSLKR